MAYVIIGSLEAARRRGFLGFQIGKPVGVVVWKGGCSLRRYTRALTLGIQISLQYYITSGVIRAGIDYVVCKTRDATVGMFYHSFRFLCTGSFLDLV